MTFRRLTAGALTVAICLFGLSGTAVAADSLQTKKVKAPHAPKPVPEWGRKPTDHPKLDRKLNDRADQGAAVGEVVIRRRVAHARAAGDFAQREAVDASLGEELEAGIEEGPPQVAVVVAGPLSLRGT